MRPKSIPTSVRRSTPVRDESSRAEWRPDMVEQTKRRDALSAPYIAVDGGRGISVCEERARGAAPLRVSAMNLAAVKWRPDMVEPTPRGWDALKRAPT
jgi:hypothetical protein